MGKLSVMDEGKAFMHIMGRKASTQTKHAVSTINIGDEIALFNRHLIVTFMVQRSCNA